MRVLHVTNAFPTEMHPEYGVFIKDQIESLPSSIESLVIFINGRDFGWFEYVKMIPQMRTAAREVDLVHCHHILSYFAWLLTFCWGKPTVLSFLNDWTKELEGNWPEALKSWLCRLPICFASAVIFKSEPPSKLRCKENVYYLPNGVDGDFFAPGDKMDARAALGLPQDAYIVLFVSSKWLNRVQKRKDRFEALCDAVEKGLAQSGEARRVLRLYASADTRNHYLQKLISADVHLLTSDYEGSPNSVKESLSCGTPVVATRVGNVELMLRSVPYSYSFDASDESSQEEAIKQLISLASHPADQSLVRKAFQKLELDKASVAVRLSGLYFSVVRR